MSFYVRRNYTVLIVLALGALAWGTNFLVSGTQKEKKERAEKLAASRAETARKNQQRKDAKAKRDAELAAEAEAKEAAKLAEQEALAMAEAERLQRERELAAELEAQKKLEEQAQAEREFAWKQFEGTSYTELSVAGATLRSVTVLSANAIGITVSHAHGARKLKYEDLPQDIQKRCLYDPEHTKKTLAAAAERRERLKQEYKEATKKSSNSRTTASSKPQPKASHQSGSTSKNKTEAIWPRGSISVRVVRQYRRYYSPLRKEVHFKDLEVKAVSNVSANLFLNGSRAGSLQPMKRQTFTLTSGPHGKYTLELKTTKGKLLDSEKHNRKTGL